MFNPLSKYRQMSIVRELYVYDLVLKIDDDKELAVVFPFSLELYLFARSKHGDAPFLKLIS